MDKSWRFLVFLLGGLLSGLLSGAAAFGDESPVFTEWLEALKLEASQQGISDQTIDATLKDAEYLPRVIELDRSQPEFISTFLTYINKRVTTRRIEVGRQKLKAHAQLFDAVEAQYGVPKNILAAFWGLETNYGATKGSYRLPSALMTLSYEGRRATFFRHQLLDLMRILDARHGDLDMMRGSWAGAMGHMQFMPSTFLAYSQDANQDGRNDIWTSLPDAFASAANYLSTIGWVEGEPVAMEVKLPTGFAYYQAQIQIKKDTQYWIDQGVTQADGSPLPALRHTAILIPQGWKGPAFLVTKNFTKVMQWNRSINYALSVSHLANQFSGDHPLVHGVNVQNEPITFDQAWALQTRLNQMGYPSGKPDGLPGRKTKQAIRQYQLDQQLPVDGYPSKEMFERIMGN